MKENIIEILIGSGQRFRYPKDNFFWQYSSTPEGTDDKTVVEVCREEDDEIEILWTHSNVIRVGCVDENTMQEFPRERRVTQCPRCGYGEFADDRSEHEK